MLKKTRISLAVALATSLLAHASAFASATDENFTHIYTQEWQWRQNQETVNEDSGSAIVPSHLPSVTPAAEQKKLKRWLDVQKQLAALDLSQLTGQNLVNYQVYKAQIDALVAAQQFRMYEKPIEGDTAFWTNITYIAEGTFHTEQDYRNYLTLLTDMPRYFNEQIDNMRAGLARGFTPPKVSMLGKDATVAAVAELKDGSKSGYFAPFEHFPGTFSETLKQELTKKGKQVIEAAVIPAHKTLLTFLQQDYIPGAQPSLAAYDLPDGKAFYRSQIKEYTTLDMTPEEIHKVGLAEVKKIRERMAVIMHEVQFDGSLREFLDFLRSDPQFYVAKPQDLLDRAAWIAKEFDGKASDWFGRLPRSRFAIIPVPDSIAPYYTAGRGGPGVYLVNTYNLPARPLYSLPALTLHESAPGHAFQMPLANENEDLPDFRRQSYISAFGEGWALYSEALGEEMGMYHTPYELFGMLSYQMWRACRLVVDTGIHAKGWTRKQAQDFMADNTALSTHEITTEVDRYIAWPGQALSYYLGEMTMFKVREKAEKALGEKFDIRNFHDTVLELGSVPLPVLEARIDRFIAEGGKSPYAN